MSLLTAHDLSLSFGAFDVFTGINLRLANDGKVGLIGPNGIGKTSLLLILAGLSQPTTGHVSLARGRRIGYLRQEAVEAFGARTNTLYAEMLSVFAPLQEQQTRLHALEAQMAAGSYDATLLEEYGQLQEAFTQAGGYDYDLRIQQTLQGLGLGRRAWEQPVCQLSGGQQTRALLARLLLEQPDLLMLDEPTNHLDAEATEWLEQTLSLWAGAVLVASHDRYFLDNAVTTIWEMSRSGIEVYHGNYSAYVQQREERWEYFQRVFEEEKGRLLNEVDFIQRNWVRASTHGRALGMLRRVSRKIVAAETFGIQVLRSEAKWHDLELRVDRPLDVVDAIRRVNALELPGRPPRLRPRLAASQKTGGNLVLRVGEALIGYPSRPLFSVTGLELRRGECAALIGPNGSGKTTFLKTLLEQIAPLRGEVTLGANLKIGYFAQTRDELNPENTVLDELLHYKNLPLGQARSHLALYLFRGEDVFKPVSALSGGERSRLALAILALEGANFLLLDEPTNHLDLPAQEALQELLENFSGTILLVSHDRYLVDRLATQIWELRGGKLQVFKGTYHALVESRNAAAAPASQPKAARTAVQAAPEAAARKAERQQQRQQAQRLAAIEARIQEQEAALQRLNAELQAAGKSQAFERLNQLSGFLAK
jgi:ATP-binding cassette subfamily F protein 3